MANASWKNVQSNASRKVSMAYNDIKDDGIFGILAWLILVVFISLFCKVISINVLPYAIVFGDTLPAPSGIPIIGWAYDVIVMAYTSMGAFLAWALLNLGQCLWIVISLDRKVHRSVLTQMSAEHRLQGLEGRSDSSGIRQMRKRSLKLPAAILTYAGVIAIGCYVAESIINFKAYPPVNDFSRFLTSLALGKFEVFNVENILKFLWGMFSTEAFVVAIIVICLWIQARKEPTGL